MSNETKQEVFDEVLQTLYEYMMDGEETPWPKDPECDDFQARFDAALPDDLPVISKDVSEWLTWCKRKHHSLKDSLDGETRVSEDVFARAWVLGVWRVEEPGEIVKLEAED